MSFQAETSCTKHSLYRCLYCIVFHLCIVCAENRLDCGFDLRRQKRRQTLQLYGVHHHFDHDPILFDFTSLGDSSSSIFHLAGLSDIGDELDNDDGIDQQWQSPLRRMSNLPSLSTESSSGMNRVLASPFSSSSQETIISTGPQHTNTVDITKQQQQQHRYQHSLLKTEQLRTRSTGTTVVALLANNSTVLILAADTRATDGTIVADKSCKKLHALSSNVWCAGAGTSADVEALVRRVKFTFWKRGRKEGGSGVGNCCYHNNTIDINWDEDNALPLASVPTMLHYIRTQLGRMRGDLGANLLVGGYDYNSNRALLAALHPHGSMDVVNYSALGSGGLAAMGVLESIYPTAQCWGGRRGGKEHGHHRERSGITVEEGIQLAVDAVKAGIENDLGSGSHIDVCVIRREGAFCQRAIVREQELTWTTSVHVHDGAINGRQGNKRSKSSETNGVDSKVLYKKDDGVNGFGNVPFSIRSRRIVHGGHHLSDSGQKGLENVGLLERMFSDHIIRSSDEMAALNNN